MQCGELYHFILVRLFFFVVIGLQVFIALLQVGIGDLRFARHI